VLLALPGILAGTVAALVLTRFMRAMLYQVAPTDPRVYLQLVVLVLLLAAVAAYAPARRAASIDPARALRED
jgi:ABC-type antimicrobial peptide transport system permease subunit